MIARISSIEYALPAGILTNEELSRQFPEWSVDKIKAKTGIESRRIAAEGECSSDLGFEAARKLLNSDLVLTDEIDFLLLCTQSPDYFLPTTACLLQDRLGLPTSVGALDFNLGCSGFVYGLGMAKGFIESGQARNVLLITAETYSKYINHADKSVRTIFGDGAAATLVKGEDGTRPMIGFPVYGSDGSGGGNLIVPVGGMRRRAGSSEQALEAAERTDRDLYMNGSEIFAFTIARVPATVDLALRRASLNIDDIDLFVFHQANAFMLEHLRMKCGIPESKFFVGMGEIGNTVSSSIPIALKQAEIAGSLRRGMKVMLSGFGVGYSWATCVVEW